MTTSPIETAVASVDEFVVATLVKAQTLAVEQAKVAALQAEKWQALYDTIPEGRLRTLGEVGAIKSAVDQSAQASEQVKSQVSRIDQLINGPTAPGMLPGMAFPPPPIPPMP